jgi:hypothetical protein
MAMARAPKLNETVQITVTISAARDAPNTTAMLDLPSSAVLVSGTSGYGGDLVRGKPQEFYAAIAFKTEGDWTVRAIARRIVSKDEVCGDAAYIYLHVGKESSHFGFGNSSITPFPTGGLSTPPAITPSR